MRMLKTGRLGGPARTVQALLALQHEPVGAGFVVDERDEFDVFHKVYREHVPARVWVQPALPIRCVVNIAYPWVASRATMLH